MGRRDWNTCGCEGRREEMLGGLGGKCGEHVHLICHRLRSPLPKQREDGACHRPSLTGQSERPGRQVMKDY